MESKLDQLYTIGELFKKYLCEGSKIKENLLELLTATTKSNPKDYYHHVKRLNNLFSSNNKKKIENYFEDLEETYRNSMIIQISNSYRKLKIIQNIINEIAFLLYDLTSDEKKLVMEGS